jgi:NAD(P)-dependent dehydrogenase (short-subunit alcohol dehydrogenase family)
VIINISSVAGRLWGKPITWAYDASKHALGTLSDGLALEVQRFGIRVRVIEPGVSATNMLQNSVRVHEPGSPYAEIEAAVGTYFDQSAANAPGAKPVADAMLEAARAADPWPVHTLVGDDAKALVASYESSSEHAWITRTTKSLRLA